MQHRVLTRGAVLPANCSNVLLMDPDSVWNTLTEVERTSLYVALLKWRASQQYKWQSGPKQGQPLYSDPYGKLWVDYCIPKHQQELFTQQSDYQYIPDVVAVRTAELDGQIAEALSNSSSGGSSSSGGGIQQMVILGAGTDTRAWRLHYPANFTIFEVDSPAVFQFKARIMKQAATAAAAAQQQQQQCDVPGLQCDRRVEIAADASDVEDLWVKLRDAGFDEEKSTLYLMEGFIGYLSVSASNTLLSHIYTHTAPGSRIAITAPPPAEAKAQSATHAPAATTTTSGLVDEPLGPGITGNNSTGADDNNSSNNKGSENAGVPVLKLYHHTFEEPTDTLERLKAAGWSDCQLLSKDCLTSKYGTTNAQPILLGRK